MKIGMIGLGNMGGPMADWVLKAGFPLVVHDLRKDTAAGLMQRGATWADSPQALAEQCDLVATCVPGPLEMETVALGPQGLVNGIRSGAIYIDHTTNSPETVRRVGTAIRERHADMLDAPVDGGREGALAGDLTLFVGGERPSLQRSRPVLDSFSKRVVWMGELGSGSVTKIVHNALAMSIDLLLTECLTMGIKSGVGLPQLVKAVAEGTALGGNMGLRKRWPDTVFRGDFTARFALRLAHKDFGLAAELSDRYGVPTRLIDICREEISEALRRGWGHRDRTSATLLQEERAGVKLRLPNP